jgi:hypothetical protein
MKRLCNDLKYIIYRYVFDYNSKKTRQEYKKEYLKFWNDKTHEFFGDGMGCNYRSDTVGNNVIYRIVDNGDNPIAKLPWRYYYTVLPEDILPENILPEDTLPENILPEDTLPDDILPDDILPDDILPDDILPDDILPDDIHPDDKLENSL